jgi:DNA polymerase II small subunit
VPQETPARIVRALASQGFNAEREAVTKLADAPDPASALERAIDQAPQDAVKLTVADAEAALEAGDPAPAPSDTPPEMPGDRPTDTPQGTTGAAVESTAEPVPDPAPSPDPPPADSADPIDDDGRSGDPPTRDRERSQRQVTVAGDMTGQSTGTGEYEDFVAVFRDRYERLSAQLRGRVNHRPTRAVASMPGGSDAAIIGMVAGVDTTVSGHWLLELEDTSGTFPCLVMKDRPLANAVGTILHDEVVAVEGTLSDDGEILFVDEIHFPDVPRTHDPATADRPVSAALISDVHVGSQEFMADAWERFADWLHTEEAAHVEYLLIGGDMVEGVGVYPDQDEELSIVDVYEQYEAFAEHLKAVPGDLEIRMIPGNHDAVRLAEPQPGFDEEARSIMSVHDATVHSNPAIVSMEGVSVLMYHGVSLDEVIAELPDEAASYDAPHDAMAQLLKKRHLAPQFGGQTRLAPEERDYLVIEDVPDVFHAGHVHKLGCGTYHDVLTINSGCWQSQTAFQERVNLDPDPAIAPILDLQTLELTVRKFA